MAARYTIVRDFERPDPAVVKRINDAIFLFAVMAAGPRQVMNASIKALDQAIQTHGGAGLTSEYGLAALLGNARIARVAPVSREMILNFVSQHSLGLPRSY